MYKYGCGYCHTKKYTWYILVYLTKQPDVPSKQRAAVHKDHEWQVFLTSDAPHCNHALPQVRSPIACSCSGLASDQKCSV